MNDSAPTSRPTSPPTSREAAPGTGALAVALDNSYARAVPPLSVPWRAAAAPAPRLLALNGPLARQLGLDSEWLAGPEGVAFLLGAVPEETPTYAQAYSGHQFGGFSPVLGDGRALLLGEVVDTASKRYDIHLKGSGATPFARRGDGKAAVGPMLREFLISEAMHALGIPTTRSLAVVGTGEPVYRENGPLPGAVLCRVAASHLRVGTFQYAAGLGDVGVLRALADYAIERHHPAAAQADRPYLAFYEAVTRAQAHLVAQWMGVGFIHGVMNTDNMTISGETIDYGPCAFMDAYDPATVFSSIDHGGRYAYGNQPGIAQWNLARLGEALLPLIGDHEEAAVADASGVLQAYIGYYSESMRGVMAAKLGVPVEALASDPQLVTDLTDLLQAARVDHTGFFRGLADGTARDVVEASVSVSVSASVSVSVSAYDAWAARRDLLTDPALVAALDRVNPLNIPRNHRVEEALAAATDGEMGPFDRLLEAVTHPFEVRPEWVDLIGPAPEDGPRHVTFCGT